MDTMLYILDPIFNVATIIVVVAVIALALKGFNKKFPEVAERFKDATPWMGWTEKPSELFNVDAPRIRANRWN